MQPLAFQQLPPSQQQPIRKMALLAAATPAIQFKARRLAARIPKLGTLGALELLAAIGRKMNEEGWQ